MCIIILKKNNGKIMLIKNRDRNYKPKIQIIHEIRNGIEIAYIRDMDSEWCEGLNECGVGIVNAALEIEYDENPLSSDNINRIRSKEKYLNALAKSNPIEIIDNVFDRNFYTDISLQGHTLIASPKFSLHLESNAIVKPSANILSDDTYVLTNHGVNLKESGYLSGFSLVSSILRQKIADYELKNNEINEPDDIFKLLNKNYSDLNIDFHTYRNNKKNLWTTGQILLNLTDKILMYQYDIENGYFQGIVTNLPEEYEPKIKIVIKDTKKDTNNCNSPIVKEEIDQIIEKYTKK